MAVNTLADELHERHFVGVEKLERRKNANRIKASLHANIDARKIGEFEIAEDFALVIGRDFV